MTRTEAAFAAFAIFGASGIALLLYQVHLDALAKQRLTLECERYGREIQRLSASSGHEDRENRECGKWLERSVEMVSSCLKAIPTLP